MQIFALLAITLLVTPSTDAQKKTDREHAGLLGVVRSVRTQVTDYADRELQKEVRTKESDTVSYGEDGSEVGVRFTTTMASSSVRRFISLKFLR